MRQAIARLCSRVRRFRLEQQHPNLSRVWTLRHARTGRTETYVVCLDCGREFEYDLATMRLTGREMQRPAQTPDAVALERAWRDQAVAALEAERPGEALLVMLGRNGRPGDVRELR